jgi:5-methylcytosine-specific restriction endonuclease McrA
MYRRPSPIIRTCKKGHSYFLKKKSKIGCPICRTGRTALWNKTTEGKTYNEKYRVDNKSKYAFYNGQRRALKMKATPLWLTKEQKKEILEFYSLAKELQWLSEEPLHVDHIVPLQGKEVCGLHVPWNLQIIPKSMNLRKKNRL